MPLFEVQSMTFHASVARYIVCTCEHPARKLLCISDMDEEAHINNLLMFPPELLVYLFSFVTSEKNAKKMQQRAY